MSYLLSCYWSWSTVQGNNSIFLHCPWTYRHSRIFSHWSDDTMINGTIAVPNQWPAHNHFWGHKCHYPTPSSSTGFGLRVMILTSYGEIFHFCCGVMAIMQRQLRRWSCGEASLLTRGEKLSLILLILSTPKFIIFWECSLLQKQSGAHPGFSMRVTTCSFAEIKKKFSL